MGPTLVLPPDRLARHCDPATMGVATTAELRPGSKLAKVITHEAQLTGSPSG